MATTVYVTIESLGVGARQDDVPKMVAALQGRGYNAVVGPGRTNISDDDREGFDEDWLECLEGLQ
jgi:hypothetical protein